MSNLIVTSNYVTDLTDAKVDQLTNRLDQLAGNSQAAAIDLTSKKAKDQITIFLTWVKDQDWTNPIPLTHTELDRVCGDPRLDVSAALRDCLTAVPGPANKTRHYTKNIPGFAALAAAIRTQARVEKVLRQEQERALRIAGVADELLRPDRYEQQTDQAAISGSPTVLLGSSAL